MPQRPGLPNHHLRLNHVFESVPIISYVGFDSAIACHLLLMLPVAIHPTLVDLWLVREMAAFFRLHERLDLLVNGAIEHNVLGGVWYGLALFVIWAEATRKGQREIQTRVLTTLVGSTLAVLLTFAAGALFSWPPPANHPGLANLFPQYLDVNPNTNCFPSQSTALYSAVAAGVFSLHRVGGCVLWVLVPICIALPRMYVGGHFATDILVSLVLALAGYALARCLLEPRALLKLGPLVNQGSPRLRLLVDVFVFFWILQVTVEFRDILWLMRVMESLLP